LVQPFISQKNDHRNLSSASIAQELRKLRPIFPTSWWRNLQVIGTLAGVALAMGFLYSTISVALTGRTLGMRVFGIRVVDIRTGLIPTGKQSAGRALLYLASLLSAGILLALALVDSERQATHDRVSRTVVVRA
jgi:uncharacterized RDD family membrane protein YckC